MRRSRHEITDKRKAEFEQRPNEDPYQWVARQLDIANPFEAAWLMLIRDDKQRQAMEVLQQARTARWTRWAVVVALLSVPVNISVSLLA
jgi:hypothetical protein